MQLCFTLKAEASAQMTHRRLPLTLLGSFSVQTGNNPHHMLEIYLETDYLRECEVHFNGAPGKPVFALRPTS